MMSVLAIEYKLTAMLIGQMQTGTLQNQQIIQTTRDLFVRQMDPPPAMPETVAVEGAVTGPMGIFGKGSTKVEGQLLTPRTDQNSEALIKITVDNS